MDFYDSRSVKSEVFIEGNIALYIAQAHTKPPFSQPKKWSGEQLSEIFANLIDILHCFFVENGYLCDITLKNEDGERHQPHQSGSCREEKNQQVAGRAVRLCPHHRVKMVHQLLTTTSGSKTDLRIAKVLDMRLDVLIKIIYYIVLWNNF